MNERTARLIFFRGILFATRQYLEEFNTDPNGNFHEAFGKMLKKAKKTIPDRNFEFLRDVHRDPIFGVYGFAIQMVHEGEEDLVLFRLKHRVIFDISKSDAKRELEAVSNVEWFGSLAKKFTKELSRQHASV